MPVLSTEDQMIVRNLERTGVHVCALDDLRVDGSDTILSICDSLTHPLAGIPVPDDDYVVSARAEDVIANPRLIRWGLDERLLAIVRTYIGTPISYRGLTVRRDVVGGPLAETRMWHRDSEDNRIVKIIVYLNDIGEDGGPFEFVPVKWTPATWRVPYVNSSRVSDVEMRRLVPPAHWTPCTGARGTVVFVDTCRVFHRGRVAEKEDRRTLFYCYNSRQPISPQWCLPLFDTSAFLTAYPNLSETQRTSIRAMV
jgi:hypothetical protein